MEMLRGFYAVYILHVALISLAMVHAQDDQSGFISIDCGIPESSTYTDKKTGITYVSDAGFVEGGVNGEISAAYNRNALDLHLATLRSFPQNTRNCYTLRPKQGKNNRYLIRLRFLYGNYDSKGQPPRFDVYLGADLWSKLIMPNPSAEYYIEIIHLAPSDYIHICLVNTGQGTPFVSAIELRLLDISMYEPLSTSLNVHQRCRYGSNEWVRYADDKYDRIWFPFTIPRTRTIQTTSNTVSPGPLQVPSRVMSTAITSTNNLLITWNSTGTTFIFYLHFAGVETLRTNQTREFNIYLNGNHMYGPLSPSTNITSLKCTAPPLTGFSASYTFEINKTFESTLPPLINALEIYTPMQFQLHKTEDQDAAAMWSLMSTYGLKRNWQGDPCVPHGFLWDGLDCNYNDPEAAKIISLNLSSSGLSGEIVSALANLTMIESLDLSYNNLIGNVPEILAQLDNLKILNLTGNNFTRPLPAQLLEKSRNGSLLLSIEESSGEDQRSCLEGSCRNNKRKISRVVIAAISIALAAVVILSLFSALWIIKRERKKALIKSMGGFTLRKQQFTYFEVVAITNNFQNEIGRGGFGSVFHGSVEDNQVAVKMLSESSSQGYKEFQAEVKLLMEIHHTNITSLVWYCNDKNHKAIIYDFMANGNLGKHLFDGIPNVLSWERRIQIGCDVAEGLAYMHHGCRTPIVHRDVKSSNILLNEGFQAKLADFGLSRAYPTEDASYVSSKVAGTAGYLDPEYYSTNRLTEKTDVYSFGVVLLELITGRAAVSDGTNIVKWVNSSFERGNIETIIDSRLDEHFDINTAWKMTETAMDCVSHPSVQRPTMNDVVVDLKHCLQALKTRQTEQVSLNLESISDIHPR
ncbi:hypothetical protein E3N88_09932 [Mikania micrantha]|uniref:non-specific serine/threonine protein kinase n=1 Tax=Mikania micrantha TaxID=192012 RepID=A0A5N6P926_9ASTR|nr:hypothetical protein E3N88_09932 [Mikania micrantha]